MPNSGALPCLRQRPHLFPTFVIVPLRLEIDKPRLKRLAYSAGQDPRAAAG